MKARISVSGVNVNPSIYDREMIVECDSIKYPKYRTHKADTFCIDLAHNATLICDRDYLSAIVKTIVEINDFTLLIRLSQINGENNGTDKLGN